MKKSLVITTIATMLVIVVALTTATFAWFSTSTVSTVNNNFNVSPSDSAVSIYRWKPEQGATAGAYEATPLTANWTIGAGGDYEWDYATATTAGSANDAYTLLMPTKEILGNEFASNTGDTANKDGLPSVNFFRAQKSNATQDKVTAINVHPVAVRFRLMPGKSDMTIKATITVNVAAGATSKDYLAAQAARVLLIGKTEATATEETPNIMIATNYKYSTGVSAVDDVLTSASYSTTNYSQTLTGSDLIGILDTSVITSGTAAVNSATSALQFSADPTNALDCVLYIWFDGGTASDSAALGAITVSVDFSEVTEEP